MPFKKKNFENYMGNKNLEGGHQMAIFVLHEHFSYQNFLII